MHLPPALRGVHTTHPQALLFRGLSLEEAWHRPSFITLWMIQRGALLTLQCAVARGTLTALMRGHGEVSRCAMEAKRHSATTMCAATTEEH